MITATPEKKALEKLNSIRRTKVRTQKKAKKRFCCHHHHQLRKSGSALRVVTVTQIHHQVNPGFNVASVKDGRIMYAAVLTWSIFVKTVLKTIKIEQCLIESKTLHHFLSFIFYCSLGVHHFLQFCFYIDLCLYSFVSYCSLFVQLCFLVFFACMIVFQFIAITCRQLL